MSQRLQDAERNLIILNTQMGVLTRFVGYLASYTVADNEIEHVKKYVCDNIEKCRTSVANESQHDILVRIVSEKVWSEISDQLA